MQMLGNRARLGLSSLITYRYHFPNKTVKQKKNIPHSHPPYPLLGATISSFSIKTKKLKILGPLVKIIQK